MLHDSLGDTKADGKEASTSYFRFGRFSISVMWPCASALTWSFLLTQAQFNTWGKGGKLGLNELSHWFPQVTLVSSFGRGVWLQIFQLVNFETTAGTAGRSPSWERWQLKPGATEVHPRLEPSETGFHQKEQPSTKFFFHFKSPEFYRILVYTH